MRKINLKNTNNHTPKMLDKLKHMDYWHHLWWPFWIFSNARIMRRTPGSDSAPPTIKNSLVVNFSTKMPARLYLSTLSGFPTSPTNLFTLLNFKIYLIYILVCKFVSYQQLVSKILCLMRKINQKIHITIFQKC